MEQDREQWPKFGLTGDPKEDRQRKKSVLYRIERIRKEYKIGQTDLFAGLGGSVRPISEKKFDRDRKTVMIGFALGLDEYIPSEMAAKFNLEPGPNPPTNYVDDGKAPF